MRTLPSRPQLLFVCGASKTVGKCVNDLCLGRLWKGFSRRKTRAVAQCDECLSASVYKFSSPALKLGHGFKILNLTLEFRVPCWRLSTGRKRPMWELVSAASWYTAEFWSTTAVVLCVVGTTSASISARSNATGLAVLAPIDSTITVHVQGSRSISLKVPPPPPSARRS